MIKIEGEKVRVKHETVISEQQYKKLLSDEAMVVIGNLETDLQISTYVEKKGTSYVSIAWISPKSVEVDNNLFHELEMHHHSFLSAIDKWEPECPSKEDDEVKPTNSEQEKVDFIKELLSDIDKNKEDEDHVIGAIVMKIGPSFVPFPIEWGKISRDLLRELCELYIAKHERESYDEQSK